MTRAMSVSLSQQVVSTLLGALVLVACASPATVIPAGGGVGVGASAMTAEPRELTADQQVAHVLNRLAYGARPGDAERVRAIGVDRWIERQLAPERIDDAATARFIERAYPTIARATAELLRESAPPVPPARPPRAAADSGMAPALDTAGRARARRTAQRTLGELQSAKLARAVTSERQLEEVMVDFWENHFSVFAGKGPVRYFLPEYTREAIRPHALGKFRTLLGAVAASPAMLFYLDNWQSGADSGRPVLGPRRVAARRRAGLNENYARELLELHTLGVDGGYTQHDVIEVARAFTGWSIEQPRSSGEFIFRPILHDASEKTVLGVRLRPGRGIEDGRQVLDIVAAHPATARHIARKLTVRFVSDDPPEALVERAAATFTRTGGDIREVVRTIVTSPEFFSRAAWRAKVKSPFEVVASALRVMGADADPTPRAAQLVARLGQPLYLRETPDGWPETGAEWINAGAILNRINFGLMVGAGRAPGVALERWPPARTLVRAPREAQVDGVIAALFDGEASPDTRSILVSGESPMHRETPDTPRRRLDGLPLVIGLALGAPEFQRR
ncbi:MAG TPA: DUF1800 domain-containing protein [Gemmatimonadaceae bacterium]|nr:DUF1800 domain-containing protein [Gemmatimonadaceae bacterium]